MLKKCLGILWIAIALLVGVVAVDLTNGIGCQTQAVVESGAELEVEPTEENLIYHDPDEYTAIVLYAADNEIDESSMKEWGNKNSLGYWQKIIDKKTEIILPTPSLDFADGRSFMGWRISSDNVYSTKYKGGEKITLGPSDDDIVLYATFGYTLTVCSPGKLYDFARGTLKQEVNLITEGAEYIKYIPNWSGLYGDQYYESPLADPPRESFSFSRWGHDDRDRTEVDVSSYMVESDTTIWAVWKRNYLYARINLTGDLAGAKVVDLNDWTNGDGFVYKKVKLEGRPTITAWPTLRIDGSEVIFPESVNVYLNTMASEYDTDYWVLNNKITIQPAPWLTANIGGADNVNITDTRWECKATNVVYQTQVNVGDKILGILNKLTLSKSGWNFDGWSATSGGVVNVTATTEMGDSDTTVYAVWSKCTHKVTIVSNGGSISKDGSEITSIQCQCTTKIKDTLKTLTANHYDSSYELGYWDYNGKPLKDEEKMPDNEISIKAIWVTTVKFMMNDDTNTEYHSSKLYIEDIVPLPEDPTREDYQFDGWYTKSEDFSETNYYYFGDNNEVPETGGRTYYAKWTKIWTLTLDPNGGTFTGEVPSKGTLQSDGKITFKLAYGDSMPDRDELSAAKTGYTANNNDSKLIWYDSDSNETIYTATTMPDNNLTLYVHWTANTYTVTYKANGGYFSLPNGAADKVLEPTYDGKKLIQYKVKETYGSTYQGLPGLQDLTRDGYRFERWWYEDGNYEVSSVNTVTIAGDHELIAQWEVVEYTITLDLNDGTLNGYTLTATNGYPIVIENTVTYTIENSFDLPTKSHMTRNGYEFAGWTITEANDYYDGRLRRNEDAITHYVTKINTGSWTNATLTAQWSINSYTITLDSNGGTLAGDNSITYTIESPTFGLPGSSWITRNGYIFLGWAITDANYDRLRRNEDVNGYVTAINKGSWTDATLTAQWDAIQYKITLDLKGGSVNVGDGTSGGGLTYVGTDGARAIRDMDDSKILYNAYISFYLPNHSANNEKILVQRKGYTFLGWTITAPGEGGLQYSSENGYVTKINTGSWTNATLTAQWEVVEYTITLDLKDGTLNGYTLTATNGYPIVNENTITYTVETSFALPTESHMTRNGYTFSEWTYTSEDVGDRESTYSGENGNIILSGEGSTKSLEIGSYGDVKLVANWDVNVYTINVDMAGGAINTSDGATRENLIYSATSQIDVVKDRVASFEYSDEGSLWVIKYTIEIDNFKFPNCAAGENSPVENVDNKIFVQRKGYIFRGWVITGIDEGERAGNDESDYANDSTITEIYASYGNFKITAQWEAKEYTISLDVNGGDNVSDAYSPVGPTVSDNSITYTIETATFALPKESHMHRTGYKFTGWQFTEARNDDAGVEDASKIGPTWWGALERINGDYSKDTETITQNYTDFTRGGTYATGIKTGSWSHIEFTAVWAPIIYQLQVDVNNGFINTASGAKGKGLIYINSAYMPLDQSSLYDATPKAVLNWNEGDTIARIYFTIETVFALPNERDSYGESETIFIQRKGYSFIGWEIDATTPASIKFSTYDNYALGVLKGSYCYDKVGDEVVDGKIKAKWEIVEYTVTLNANGGTLSGYTLEADSNGYPKVNGNKITYTIETPTFALPTRYNMNKAGYAFLAWQYDLNSTDDPHNTWKGTETEAEYYIDGAYSVTDYAPDVGYAIAINTNSWSHITLTAVWRTVYEIKLDLAGGYYNVVDEATDDNEPNREHLYYNGVDVDLIKFANLLTTDNQTGVIYFTEMTQTFTLPHRLLNGSMDSIQIQRQGYHLARWEAVNGASIYYLNIGGGPGSNDIYKIGTGSTSNGEISAVWEAQVYTINLELDGGSFEYGSYNISDGTGYPKMYEDKMEYRIDCVTFAMPQNDSYPYLLKDGYTFVGWENTTVAPDDPCTTWIGAETIDGYYELTYDDDNYVTHINVGNWSTIELTAIWARVYTITIDVNYDADIDIAGLREYINNTIPETLSRGQAETRPSKEFPFINQNLSASEINAYTSEFSADYIIYYIEGNEFDLPIDVQQIGKRGYSLAGWSYRAEGQTIEWASCPHQNRITAPVAPSTIGKENAFVKADWSENTYTFAYHIPTSHTTDRVDNFVVNYTDVWTLNGAGVAQRYSYTIGSTTYKYQLVGWVTVEDCWGNHDRNQPNYTWFGTNIILNPTEPYNARYILGSNDFTYVSGSWTYSTEPICNILNFFDKDAKIQYTAHSGVVDIYPVLTPIYDVVVHAKTNSDEGGQAYKDGVNIGEEYIYEVDYFNLTQYLYQLPEAEAITPDGGNSYIDNPAGSIIYRLGGSFYELFWKYHIITGYEVRHADTTYIYDKTDGWKDVTVGNSLTPHMNMMGAYSERDVIIYNTDITSALAPNYTDDVTIDIYPNWEEFTFNVNFYASKYLDEEYKANYSTQCITTQNAGLIGAVKYGQDYGIAIGATSMAGLTASGYAKIDAIDIMGYTFDHASPYVYELDRRTGNPHRLVVDKNVVIAKTGADNLDGDNQPLNKWDYPKAETGYEYYYKVGKTYWIDIEGYYNPDLYRLNFDFQIPDNNAGLAPVLESNSFSNRTDVSGVEASVYKYATLALGDGVDALGNPIREIVYETNPYYTDARAKVFKQGNTYYIYILQNQALRYEPSSERLETSYDYNEYGVADPQSWAIMPTWHLDYYELQYYYVTNPSDITGAMNVDFYLYQTTGLDDNEKALAESKIQAKAHYDANKTISQGSVWNLMQCGVDDPIEDESTTKVLNMYWYRRYISLDIQNLLGAQQSSTGYVVIEETEQVATTLIDHNQYHLIIYVLNGDGEFKYYRLSNDRVADIPSLSKIYQEIRLGGIDNGYIVKDYRARKPDAELKLNGWTEKVGADIPIYIGNKFTITAFDQSKDNSLDDFIGFRFVKFSAQDTCSSDRFAGIANESNYIDKYTISYDLKIGNRPTAEDDAINTDSTFIDKEEVAIYAHFENIKYSLNYVVSDSDYSIQRYVDNSNKFGLIAIATTVHNEDGTTRNIMVENDDIDIQYFWVNDTIRSNMKVNLGTEFLAWKMKDAVNRYQVLEDSNQIYDFLLDAYTLRQYVYGNHMNVFSADDILVNTIYATCQHIAFEIMVDVVDNNTGESIDSYILGRDSADPKYSDHPVFTVLQGEDLTNYVYIDNIYSLRMLSKLEEDLYLYYYDDEVGYALLNMNIPNTNFINNFTFPTISIDDISLSLTNALLRTSITYNEGIEVDVNNRYLHFQVKVSPLISLDFVAGVASNDPQVGDRGFKMASDTIISGANGDDLIVNIESYKGYNGQSVTFTAIADSYYYSDAKMVFKNEAGAETETLIQFGTAISYTLTSKQTITVTFNPKLYTFGAKIKYNNNEPIEIEQWDELVLADNTRVFHEKPLVQLTHSLTANRSDGKYHYNEQITITAVITESIRDGVELFVRKNGDIVTITNNKAVITINGSQPNIETIIEVKLKTNTVNVIKDITEAADVKVQINDYGIADVDSLSLVAGDKVTVYVAPNVGYKFTKTYTKSYNTINLNNVDEIVIDGSDYQRFVLFDSFNSKQHAGSYVLNFTEVGINIDFKYEVIDLDEIVDNNTYIATPGHNIKPDDTVRLAQGEDPEGYRFDSYSYVQPKDVEGTREIGAEFTINGGILDYLADGYFETIRPDEVNSITLTIYVNYIRQYKINYKATPSLASVALKNDSGGNLQANRYYDRGTIVLAEVVTIKPDHYSVDATIQTDATEIINTESVMANPSQVTNSQMTVKGKLSAFTKQITLNSDCMINLTISNAQYYGTIYEELRYPASTSNTSSTVQDITSVSLTDNIYYEISGTHNYGTKVTISVYVVDPYSNTTDSDLKYYALTGIAISGVSVADISSIQTSGVTYNCKTCNRYDIVYNVNDEFAADPSINLTYSAYSLVCIKVNV